jgi:hypothetical protein
MTETGRKRNLKQGYASGSDWVMIRFRRVRIRFRDIACNPFAFVPNMPLDMFNIVRLPTSVNKPLFFYFGFSSDSPFLHFFFLSPTPPHRTGFLPTPPPSLIFLCCIVFIGISGSVWYPYVLMLLRYRLSLVPQITYLLLFFIQSGTFSEHIPTGNYIFTLVAGVAW